MGSSTWKAGLLAGAGAALGCFALVAVQSGSGAAPSEAPPLSAPATASAHGLTLTSVSVELPSDDQPYSGPGAEIMNSNCTACHSASMAVYQPPLSATEWRAEVEKMRNTYKAPVDEKAVPAIVDYLAAYSARLPRRPLVDAPLAKAPADAGATSG